MTDVLVVNGIELPYSAQQLLGKLEYARTRATNWMGRVREAYYYIMPGRDSTSEFFKYLRMQPLVAMGIWDLTATMCAKQRSNQLVAMVFPDRERWGELRLNERVTNTSVTTQILSDAQEDLYSFIENSNLAASAPSIMMDETIGQAAIWQTYDPIKRKLNFKVVPGYTVMPEYYSGDEIRDTWHPFSVSAQYIMDNYKTLPSSLMDFLKGYVPSDTYGAQASSQPFLFITRGVLIKDDAKAIFGSKIYVIDILEDRAENTKSKEGSGDCPITVLQCLELDYNPLTVLRDEVFPGNNIGYGPGLLYLDVIKRLQILWATNHEGNEIRSKPPIEVDTSKVNLINSSGRSGLVGKIVPPGSLGNPFQLPANPSVAAEIQMVRSDLQLALSVNPLGSLEQAVRTATEVEDRIQRGTLNTLINSYRLVREGSQPIFEKSFYMLLKAGEIRNFKMILSEMEKKENRGILFKYRNPLSNIQNRNDLASLASIAQIIQQFIGANGIAASFNLEQLQNFIIKISNIDPILFNDGKTFEGIIEKAMQAAAAQTQSEGSGGSGGGGGQQPSSSGGLPVPTTSAVQTPQLSSIGQTL